MKAQSDELVERPAQIEVCGVTVSGDICMRFCIARSGPVLAMTRA